MHERKEGMREEFGYRDAPTLKGQLSYFFRFFRRILTLGHINVSPVF